MSSQVVGYDVLWKLGNKFYPIIDHEAFDEICKICGERIKVYIMLEVEVDGEDENEVGEEDDSKVHREKEEGRWDSSLGNDTEAETATQLVDCVLFVLDDDISIDP